MKALQGKIAVVAGATRGAGRGIASMLGAAGATVYCTGRSTRAQKANRPSESDSPFNLASRPETIEETAEMVAEYGGVGIPVQVDHSVEAQVQALFARVRAEQGRLDVLVNDIWGGDELAEWGQPFWELTIEKGIEMQQRGVYTHFITSRYGAPLMVECGQGLIIEITDGDTLSYRGNLFYDLAKLSVIRLAQAMAEELRPHNVTALALTPGFLRSEAMLEHFGVTAENWQEGAKKDPHFIASETPFYVGRAVAALAADPDVASKSGGLFSSWGAGRSLWLHRHGRPPAALGPVLRGTDRECGLVRCGAHKPSIRNQGFPLRVQCLGSAKPWLLLLHTGLVSFSLPTDGQDGKMTK